MVFDETEISKLRTFFDKLMKDEQEKQNVIMKEEALRKATQHPVFCAFFDEHFIITNNDKDRIKKTELSQEFKKWFEDTQGTRKIPKGQELYEIASKKFGKVKSTGWHKAKIVYPDDEEDDTLAEL